MRHSDKISRVLVYSHDSVGLGHIFRVLAVITGIRKWRPDLEFLVLTGSSIPHILMRQGIEVIKLPGIKQGMHRDDPHLSPRYLHKTPLADILDLRKKIIARTFSLYRPDAVMIEHYLAGLEGEIMPILKAKKGRRGTPDDFALVSLTRGIYKDKGALPETPGERALFHCAPLYDAIYVFDERDRIDVNQEYLGADAAMEAKIHYLGPILDKRPEEIPERQEILERFRLKDMPILLLCLSRYGDIRGILRRLLAAFDRLGLTNAFQAIMIVDPYLDAVIAGDLRSDPLFRHVRFLPFFYPLVDLMKASEIIVCRAGYNTVNEVLMTGRKALVIPERHPSGEQERRARGLSSRNLIVASEEEILAGPPDHLITELLGRQTAPIAPGTDKYAIGKKIIEDLEAWTGS